MAKNVDICTDTHRQTRRSSTVTLAAHVHQGLQELGTSKVAHTSQLNDAVVVTFANFINNKGYVLDVPFTLEEIQGVVKRGKSSSPGNIIPDT